MGKKANILLVGQTPPPYHGQAVITAMLFDHEWQDLEIERLRMAFSDEISAVGKASLGKIFHLLGLIWKTWWIAFTKSPRVLYYLPASPNLAPVMRDFIYLAAVRWMFPKTVFHYHAGGLDQYLESKPWLKNLTKWVYNNADISIDVNVTEPATGEYFDAKKNVVVMNGLDVETVDGSESGAKFRVITMGMICEEKGILELVRTAKILKDQGVDFVWDVVGGWESDAFEAEVMKLIADLGVGSLIRFPGVLNGDAKWQAYANSDAMAFLSHHPTETFGLVLIEAMGMGLPVVTTKWRGIPHVVGGSGAAMLCDVKSPEQFAQALGVLAANADLRGEMSGNAVKYYEENYTRAKFVEGMRKEFESLLD